jgi:photosystem II stability/assembly factor-like uncharacterized protein
MRYSIPAIALLVVWFAAPVASAQTWEPLDPQPQSNTLWKVDFVDANHGWACGENGTILHTSDGGSTWETQTCETNLGIVNIRFVDTQNGWAICGSTGLGGAILHTTNGGATWTTQVSGTTYSFFTPLSALSPLECWTADGYCDLMHTNDGGATWTGRNICETAPWPGGWIYGVFFVDADQGWIVGGGAWGPNAIMHTTDGAVSWSLQTGPTDGEFDGIVSVDAQNSWIWGAGWWGNSSGGFICHTTNGGDTWTLQQSDEPYNLHELYFLDTTRGWGVGSGGTIVHTTDGGDSWGMEQTSTTLFLHGVHFTDARHGWAVGDGGVMLRYNDLAPAMPQNLAGRQKYTPPGLDLSWRRNLEADLAHYAVYRDTSADFVPGADNLIDSPTDTAYFDGDWRWNRVFYYKVSAIDINENESFWALFTPDDVTGVDAPKRSRATYLAQNVPNPFNPTTRIVFGLDAPGAVSLRIYDSAGRLVRVLVEGNRAAGHYTELWDGKDAGGSAVASGIYFYRLAAGSFVETKKIALIR